MPLSTVQLCMALILNNSQKVPFATFKGYAPIIEKKRDRLEIYRIVHSTYSRVRYREKESERALQTFLFSPIKVPLL